jgi:hypothetical protein
VRLGARFGRLCITAVIGLSITVACGESSSAERTNDYFGGGSSEGEVFDSVSAMSESSDMVVAATVADVVFSEYQFPGIDEPFAVAEIVLDVETVLGHRDDSGPEPGANRQLSVYWSLNGVSTATEDLKTLAEFLPDSKSWWFLRSEEGLDGGYRVINTAGVIEESGEQLIPVFYRGSAREMLLGSEGSAGENRRFIEDLLSQSAEDFDDMLHQSAP